MKPTVTDEMLNKLIHCLVKEFKSVNFSATFKLDEHKFSLLNRMGCAKEAGLNYEYSSSSSDGQRVTMMSSVIVDAIKELEHRGYVKLNNDDASFTITREGYDYCTKIDESQNGNWKKFIQILNEHQGLTAVISIIAAILIAVIFGKGNA